MKNHDTFKARGFCGKHPSGPGINDSGAKASHFRTPDSILRVDHKAEAIQGGRELLGFAANPFEIIPHPGIVDRIRTVRGKVVASFGPRFDNNLQI